MKELNLTKGPWKLTDKCHNPMGWERCIDNGLDQICIVECYEGDESDAKAIVTAVNNTYHKGIDPEAVADMKEALIEARNDLQMFVDDFAGTGANLDNTKRVVNQIEEALQKADLNNEKEE